MKCKWMASAAVMVAVVASVGRGDDRVFTISGKPISGKIVSMTAAEISVETRTGETVKVPANDINVVQFDGEPTRISGILRGAVRAGRYEDALRELDELQKSGDSFGTFLQADLNYMRAYCAAKLALSGNGDVAEAGKLMRAWVQANPNNYRYYEGCEILGDLLANVDAFTAAVEQYERLISAPWPEIQLRGLVAKGRALLADKKAEQALAEFRRAQSLADGAGDSASVKGLKLAANLGQAECLAATNQLPEAVKIVQQVIVAADPENVPLHARAYTTLGRCYRQAKDTKNALLAFLHVDLLYFTDPQAHAEALSNLAALYLELDDTEGANRAQQVLKQRYPNFKKK